MAEEELAPLWPEDTCALAEDACPLLASSEDGEGPLVAALPEIPPLLLPAIDEVPLLALGHWHAP
jgi:hypothetical protein